MSVSRQSNPILTFISLNSKPRIASFLSRSIPSNIGHKRTNASRWKAEQRTAKRTADSVDNGQQDAANDDGNTN
uniref:Uncharacterized protein n=1 Tax=Globodera rostochiensis TaxID=31243 RepID=A0A914HAP1_GLORO